MLAGFRGFVMVYSDFLKFSLPKQSQTFLSIFPQAVRANSIGPFTLIGKAGFGTGFRKPLEHVLEAQWPLGSPLLLLAAPGTSLLRCFMRLELPGALYLLSCRWDAWKAAPGQTQGCSSVVGPCIWVLSPWISDPSLGTATRRIPCCLEGSRSPGALLLSQNSWYLDTGDGCALCHGKTWKNYLGLLLFDLLALNAGYIGFLSFRDAIFLVGPLSFLDIGNLRLLMHRNSV